MSRTSVAVDAEQVADALPQRHVSVRLFRGHGHRIAALFLAELGAVALSFLAAIFIRFSGFSSTMAAFEATVGPLWSRGLLVTAVFSISLAALGLYQLRQRARFHGVLIRLLMAVILAETVLTLIFYALPGMFVGRGVTYLTGGFALIALAITRYGFFRLVDEDFFKRRVLVWGAGSRAASIAQRLRRRTDQRGFRIVQYIRTPGDSAAVSGARVMESQSDLVRLALRHRVEEIVVAMDDRRTGFPTAELLECRLRGIQVTEVLTFLERESGRVSVELMHPSWLIFSNGFRCDLFRLVSKRCFDIVVSLGILLLTVPVWFVTALLIYLTDRGPIFYRQTRVGQNGRRFHMLKFRSMRVDAEADGQALWASPGDTRITMVGRVIRKLRIDELPQVFNVLVGHMSFVGPRPERPEFVEKLAEAIPFYAERHFVKPGITGWAQVRYSYGASEKDAREKLEYDLYYVKHHTLAFDLIVLLLTVEIVLFRIGSR